MNEAIEEKNPEKESEVSSTAKGCYEWMEEIITGIISVVMIFTFIFRIVTVSGLSMYPNFHNGDRLVVTNSFQSLHQGDVVIVVNVLNEPIIKRVIATQGQTVNINFDTGIVYVDGKPVDERKFGIKNGITRQTFAPEPMLQFPQKVPEGCVFVLGDNRPLSEDSRYCAVGMIDTRNVLGKAKFFIYPFDRFGKVNP